MDKKRVNSKKASSSIMVIKSRSSSTESFKSIISTSPCSLNINMPNFEMSSNSNLFDANDFLSIFDKNIQKVCDSFKQNKLFEETQSDVDSKRSLGKIVSESDLSLMLESRLNEHSAKNLKEGIFLYEKIVEIGEIESHHINARALRQFLFSTADGERWKNMFINQSKIKPFHNLISNDLNSVTDSNLRNNADSLTSTEKIKDFMTNIAKTEETLRKNTTIKQDNQSNNFINDHMLIKKVNELFKELDELNDKENLDFIVDLCLLAFNYLAIAKALLDVSYNHSQIKSKNDHKMYT